MNVVSIHRRPLGRQSSLTLSVQVITLTGIQLLFCLSFSFTTSSQTIRNRTFAKNCFQIKNTKDATEKLEKFLTATLFEMALRLHCFSLAESTLLKHLDIFQCDSVRNALLFSIALSANQWAEELKVFSTVMLFKMHFCCILSRSLKRWCWNTSNFFDCEHKWKNESYSHFFAIMRKVFTTAIRITIRSMWKKTSFDMSKSITSFVFSTIRREIRFIYTIWVLTRLSEGHWKLPPNHRKHLFAGMEKEICEKEISKPIETQSATHSC